MEKEEITKRFNSAGKHLKIASYAFASLPIVGIALYLAVIKGNMRPEDLEAFSFGASILYLTLFGLISYQIWKAGQYLTALFKTHQVITNENQELKIITLDNKMVNAEVFINEKPAPDGEYSYANKKIIVENGKITEGKTIKTHQVITNENQDLKIITLDNKMVNAEVFINEKPAPDGEYSYANKKIIVENGKITEGKTIKESD